MRAERGIAALYELGIRRSGGDFIAKSSAGYALAPDAADSGTVIACFIDRIHEIIASPGFVAMTFQDPAGAVRRGGAPGLANISPDNPIWIRFARCMGPFMELDATLVADHAGDPPPRRVMDIAASHGVFALAFGGRSRDCSITGLDSGAGCCRARDAHAAGMGDRYNTLLGSAFETDWGTGSDVVLLPNFLRNFGRAGCMKRLQPQRGASSALPKAATAISRAWLCRPGRPPFSSRRPALLR